MIFGKKKKKKPFRIISKFMVKKLQLFKHRGILQVISKARKIKGENGK